MLVVALLGGRAWMEAVLAQLPDGQAAGPQAAGHLTRPARVQLPLCLTRTARENIIRANITIYSAMQSTE